MASNKEIDEKAVRLVIDYEKANGRRPERVDDNNCGYDVVSSGRKIEIKGATHGEVFRGFVIEEKQRKNFNDPNFWMYRVLKVLSAEPVILPIKPNEINLTKPQVRYNATSWKDKGKQRVF